MPVKQARAKKLDKHELYQISVQNPEFETRFLERVFHGLRGRRPRHFREDFCGTALLASEWVRRVRDGVAVGVDIDHSTLEWGRHHNVEPLGDAADRVILAHANVLDAESLMPSGFRPEVVAALNFSWFIFKERCDLLEYFRSVERSLSPDGILVIDIYGGPAAQGIQEESTRQTGFTYVWDQATYNPVTGGYLCHIHFDFPDGTRMRRAFSYDWRLWHLSETRDILRDAGFRETTVYWEGTDHETGGGNGVFRPTRKGDDSESWIAYVVALR